MSGDSQDPRDATTPPPTDAPETGGAPTAEDGWADMEAFEDPGYQGGTEADATGIPDDDDDDFRTPAGASPVASDPTPATTPDVAEPAGGEGDPTPADAELDFRARAKLLPDHDTWLERPSTIKGLKIASLGLLAATVAAEAAFVPESKAHFEGIDGWLGFHAVYGFVTCVLMVLGAKFVLGAMLKRKDTYYDD